jgi:predicted dinucleotide-binding enzyme
MPIAIIGAGAVGATLGQAWLDHGQDVIWGLRNPADPKYASLAKERVKAPAEAAKEAEIVVIATPWSATQAAVKSLGSLAGKIVIDCTNPLGMGPDGLQYSSSASTPPLASRSQAGRRTPSSSRPSTPRARAIWPEPPNIR